jgi:TonB family protein
MRTLGALATVVVLAAAGAPRGGAQAPADLLAAGRARVGARDLDSARVLLSAAADSARGGAAAVRAEAFVLLGLVHYYQGRDDLARGAFERALRLRPEAGALAAQQGDPDLTRLIEQERCRLAAELPGFAGLCTATGLTALPELLSLPALMYPDALRERGVAGRVWIAVIIDTLGMPEPGSIAVAESPDSGFNDVALRAVAGARFRPGTVGARPVRARLEVPIEFQLAEDARRDTAPPVAPESPVECSPTCPDGVSPPALRAPAAALEALPAATAAFQGFLTMDLVVSAAGTVEEESARYAARGVPLEVGELVYDMVRRSRFDPAQMDGRAVRAHIRLRVDVVGAAGRPPRLQTRLL